MYRSSLALAIVALCSAPAAASDLSSVYVAPGGVYAPSSNIYVRPGAAYRQAPYAEPGYGYRSYETPPPAYRAPAAVYGEYGYPAQPTYVERAPAYPARYYARERYYAQDQDYALEYAPRPPLPVPYRARARCDDGYGRWSYCD
ncbi:hypothetical protein CQ12_19605 [Bradyrhizobium jicamae]|uniref:Uncharacterized protein n=1 Tax=Bradyrhizobium jicamae TaxID=280332 RepID=A0A0R3LRS3_9BRAD|nr:hypothetical protein [Bradyrhizobium jicamae]KRR10673.1 hypothetical protein CQ12_19605 [Bradyrhizobium jicamae]